MPQPNYSAPAVERVLDILEIMAKENRSFTVTEMATHLEISSNSAFRIYKELEKKGYVLKNPLDSSYVLSEKLYYMGTLLQNRVSFRKIAQPSMNRLGVATKETILLTKFGENYSTFIADQLPSTEPIKFLSTVGMSYDSYNSALGKAMLSTCSLPERKKYIAETHFEPHTLTTIVNPVVFEAELDDIAKTGVAFDREEAVSGLFCLGCPVFSAGKRLEGAIGISGISFRMTPEKVKQYIPLLKKEAEIISELLGYTET